jgi:hypothetical protein
MGALTYTCSFSSQDKAMVAAPHHHGPHADMPAASHTALQTALNRPLTAPSSTYSQFNMPRGTPFPDDYQGHYQPQPHFSPPAGLNHDPNVSILISERSSPPPFNRPPVRIQVRQNGTLHSIDIPLGSPVSQREIEQLQEYAQNSNFGSTNILGSVNCTINRSLQTIHAGCTKFQKIQGGLFDGLTRDEPAWLEVAWKTCLEWKGEKFSDEEVEFLYQASLFSWGEERVSDGLLGQV